MTRLEELERILETVCGVYENDCSKCPKKAECEEYSHIYEDRNKTEDINFKSEGENKRKIRLRDGQGKAGRS